MQEEERGGDPDILSVTSFVDVEVPIITFFIHISSNSTRVSNWTRSPIEHGSSKFKSLSLFKSRFQSSLDLNPGDYGPWN